MLRGRQNKKSPYECRFHFQPRVRSVIRAKDRNTRSIAQLTDPSEDRERNEPKYPSEWPTDEAPGFSVFYRDSDNHIFHTYSSFGRGGELAIGTYHFLDLVPKGRDEDGLPFPMAWVRHHDRYDKDPSDREAI